MLSITILHFLIVVYEELDYCGCIKGDNEMILGGGDDIEWLNVATDEEIQEQQRRERDDFEASYAAHLDEQHPPLTEADVQRMAEEHGQA